MRKLPSIVFILIGLAGCSPQDNPREPTAKQANPRHESIEYEPPPISVFPRHQTTSWKPSETIRIIAVSGIDTISADAQARLVKSIALSGDVAGPIEFEAGTGESVDDLAEFNRTAVYVKPKQPLGAGWHTLTIAMSPGVFVFDSSSFDLHSERDEVVAVSRFHVGSSPFVNRIEACDTSDDRSVVFVEYSEPVSFESIAESGPSGISLSAFGKLCNYVPGSPRDSLTKTSVHYFCDDAGAKSPYSLRLSSGAFGLSGHPVGLKDGSPITTHTDLEIEMVVPSQEGCHEWRP